MKTKVLLFVMNLLFMINLQAATKYYYYEGEKVFIEENGKTAKVSVGDFSKVADRSWGIRSIENSAYSSSADEDVIAVVSAGVSSLFSGKESSDIENCFVSGSGSDKEIVPTGYLYIKLHDSADDAVLREVAMLYRLNIVCQNEYMPLWFTLQKTDRCEASVIDVCNSIYETGLFASCSPDFSTDMRLICYDPLVTDQWALCNEEPTFKYNPFFPEISPNTYGMDVSASEAWNYSTGRGVKIAIVDGGADISHEDLKNKIYDYYDFHANTKTNTYYGYHGSHCAGIAAAESNNGIGISGVAPDAMILSAAFKINETDSTRLEPIYQEIANAINWSWRNGADILSFSWGCKSQDIIKDAVDNALTFGRGGRGCIIVAASGNDGKKGDNSILFPSILDNVLSVGSIMSTGHRFPTSSYGDALFIVAPGNNILSTVPGNRYMTDNGTSMAAPLVAGIVALMLEIDPELTSDQIKRYIAMTATKIDDEPYVKRGYDTWNKYYGYGLINAFKAVLMASTYK